VRGWDFSADWERQGACWDAITNDMWKAYRNNTPIIALRPQPQSPQTGAYVFYNLKGQAVGNGSVADAKGRRLGRFFNNKKELPRGMYLCKINGKNFRMVLR